MTIQNLKMAFARTMFVLSIFETLKSYLHACSELLYIYVVDIDYIFSVSINKLHGSDHTLLA